MAVFQKQTEKVLNRVVELPVHRIRPNPSQPRLVFDDYELSQLAVSIRQNGILQPITVRRTQNGDYELICGERRLRAAKLINMQEIPGIVIESGDEESAVLGLLENLQRAELNYIEEAYAIKTLIEQYNMTQETAAIRLGLAQSTIANKLRLLRLTDEEKALVLRHKLCERQARALLRLDSKQRAVAIQKIVSQNLNTAQTDKLVQDMLEVKVMKNRRVWSYNNVGLYINTFNHTIQSMKKSGIPCQAKQNKTEDYIEYIVRIQLK
jgi:ParB family chromosome partitioning protein